jgi:hypothetical protein
MLSLGLRALAQETHACGRGTRSIEQIMQPVRDNLKVKTKIPLRIPHCFSDYDETLIAEIASANHARYEIDLGVDPECAGAAVCSRGAVSGHISAKKKFGGSIVRISSSLQGWYLPSSCNAFCGDASISWRGGEVVYRIAVRAASKEEVLRITRSAFSEKQE